MPNNFKNTLLQVLGILLFWAFGLQPINAQVPVGLTSPGVKWRYAETPNYQVIYPIAREKDAIRVAGVLDHILKYDSLIIGIKPHKVSIILQNQTVISNGFVTLAPWRSEFYLNPPQFQFAGVAPWLDLLTIHEYRHVQQITQARQGFAGKLLRVLFGQSGWAFYGGAIQPRWFLEGDAVYAETVYSLGGRGRTPAFENQYRALRLSGQKYDYEKASFFSFKDFIPSHYHLGYYLTTHARRTYGEEVWDKVLLETYNKIGLYRFSKALRQETGLTTKQLYYRTFEELDSIWGVQDKQITPQSTRLISSKTRDRYTNYRYPNYLSNGEVLVHKSSLNEIGTVYRIDSLGQEQKLFSPGIGIGGHLSTNDRTVVWSEFRFHPRWFNQSYSIIRSYDLESGVKTKITSRSKLFAPAVSGDGSRLAAVEVATDGVNSLVVLDAKTGKELDRFATDPGDFLAFPKWHPDNKRVFATWRNSQGNGVNAYHIDTDQVQETIPLTTATIDRIYPHGEFIFFSSSLTGVQNIFAWNTQTAEQFQVTETRFGAFDPSVSKDGKRLIYSEYTADGYETREVNLTGSPWKQSAFNYRLGSNYFEPLLTTTSRDLTNTRLQSGEFNTKPFKHLTKGLFNIHSWYPIVSTEEFGLAVLSKNIMSSMSLTGQFTYNTDENSWKTLFQMSYGPFFPILDATVSTGERQTENLVLTTDTLSIVGYRGRWQEHTISAGLRVPLNLTHGNYFSNLTLAPRYQHFIVDYFDGVTDLLRDEDFGSWAFEISFRRSQSTALQNILPRWAQVLDVDYQSTVGNGENQGKRLTIDGTLIFPGILKNHSFFISGAYQKEDIVDAYRFEDIFRDARGYGSGPFEHLYRISGNYTLPLFYPDLSLGSIAYFKRLRANLFYDWSQGEVLDSQNKMRSMGVELLTDFRLIRLIDVGIGVRYGYLTDRDRDFFELVISSIQF